MAPQTRIDEIILDYLQSNLASSIRVVRDDFTLAEDLAMSSLQISIMFAELGDLLQVNIFSSEAFAKGTILTVRDLRCALNEAHEN